jgi:hypothetical protein
MCLARDIHVTNAPKSLRLSQVDSEKRLLDFVGKGVGFYGQNYQDREQFMYNE